MNEFKVYGYRKSAAPIPGSNPMRYAAIGEPVWENRTPITERGLAYNLRAALAAEDKSLIYKVSDPIA